jgi:acyl carrier protein
MKATPGSIVSLLAAAAVAPGGAREAREPSPDLVERIRALTARKLGGDTAALDVDRPLAAQGCSDDHVFDLIIELEETYRIEIDEAEYGSAGDTTDKSLTVRGLARVVASYLS